jgi:hypothetical protein
MNLNSLCKCRVCGATTNYLFDGRVLSKHQVEYFECQICGYVLTEDPYWLADAYRQPITASDTGIMVRNQYNSRLVLSTMHLLGALKGTVVDYAGGYGILVRLLRDLGVNALWADRYSENLLASGFDYKGEPAQLVTAFEAFEHFVYPEREFEALLAVSPNVLISTEIIPSPTPAQNDWWYYAREHGQHIGFFRVKTLRQLARYYGKQLVTDGRSYHLFTDKVISLSSWQLMNKIVGKFPTLLTSRLSSKVWSDHLQIKEKLI